MVNLNNRRRVCVTAPNTVEVISEALPQLFEGEALIEMVVAGVCGSDVHGASGHHPIMKPPYFPGHEVVGRVVALTGNSPGIEVGDLVTPEPTLSCGTCKMCRTDRSNICESLEFLGCGYREGGMADVFSVPVSRLHKIPGDFSLNAAVLIEPLATPVHAVRLAGGVEGKTVVILGCGTIGLMVLAAAKAGGASKVIMTDMLESKRARALSFGADAVVDAAKPTVAADVRELLGESADVVFDCVSVQSTVASAFEMADRGGSVVIVGVPTREVTVPLPFVQDHQMRLLGAATYMPEDYAESIRILREGWVNVDAMITNSFPLERAAEAFVAASSGNEVKVLVTAAEA